MNSSSIGKLFCVGVGPGDPELLTLKAARILQTVDVVCTPTSRVGRLSLALAAIQPLLDAREKKPEVIQLHFPMVKDHERLREAWGHNVAVIREKLRAGLLVAYVTLGDPTLYSTFTYIQRLLREAEPEAEVELIPGVTALTACASRAGLPLAEGDETLTIVPAAYNLESYVKAMEGADNLVIVKNGRHFREVIRLIRRLGFPPDTTIAYGQDCAAPEGFMKTVTLEEASEMELEEKYFSLLIVKRRRYGALWPGD